MRNPSLLVVAEKKNTKLIRKMAEKKAAINAKQPIFSQALALFTGLRLTKQCYVGPMFASIGPISAPRYPYVAPGQPYVSPMLTLCWPMSALCWPNLTVSCPKGGYVGSMFASLGPIPALC